MVTDPSPDPSYKGGESAKVVLCCLCCLLKQDTVIVVNHAGKVVVYSHSSCSTASECSSGKAGRWMW